MFSCKDRVTIMPLIGSTDVARPSLWKFKRKFPYKELSINNTSIIRTERIFKYSWYDAYLSHIIIRLLELLRLKSIKIYELHSSTLETTQTSGISIIHISRMKRSKQLDKSMIVSELSGIHENRFCRAFVGTNNNFGV